MTAAHKPEAGDWIAMRSQIARLRAKLETMMMEMRRLGMSGGHAHKRLTCALLDLTAAEGYAANDDQPVVL